MNLTAGRTSALPIALLLFGLTEAASAACGQPATPIASIQGPGKTSPKAGQQATVEGILTLDTRTPGGFRGFYLQQADHETDGDPATSEALFVYTGRTSGELGDRLRVTGTVKEFHGLTELADIEALNVCGRGNALPAPKELTLLWPDALESLENMRIRRSPPLTVVDTWNLARYGELTLATDDIVIATEYLAPGPGAAKMAARNRQQRVLLDDARGLRQPQPVPWPPGGLSIDNTVRAGDQVHSLSGILDFRFGDWRIQPESPPVFTAANVRPAAPDRPAAPHIRVLALNLGNYFNGDGNGEGFPTPRGASTHADFQQQQRRLVALLRAPEADILALAELENDGYGGTSAIAELTRALGPQWQFVETAEGDGTDAIRTALLYRRDRIVPVAQPQRLTHGVFQGSGRPPLAQIFRVEGHRTAVRVVVPHLKSKSCRGATGNDRDQQDGQGCYAARRTRAAKAVISWLETLPTPPDLAGTLITGDLNSYYQEDPLAVFRQHGFTSQVHRFHPCTPEACSHYTYRFRGARGSLDYALASADLGPRILGARVWRVNASEPRALGYQQTERVPDAMPWRASDHNPVITDIRL